MIFSPGHVHLRLPTLPWLPISLRVNNNKPYGALHTVPLHPPGETYAPQNEAQSTPLCAFTFKAYLTHPDVIFPAPSPHRRRRNPSHKIDPIQKTKTEGKKQPNLTSSLLLLALWLQPFGSHSHSSDMPGSPSLARSLCPCWGLFLECSSHVWLF